MVATAAVYRADPRGVAETQPESVEHVMGRRHRTDSGWHREWIASLMGRSGRVAGRGAPGRRWQPGQTRVRADLAAPPCFEALESRVMLAGDHPGFNEVFVNNVPATLVTLDGSGAGSATGTISPAMDDDVFRFTAPATDFVRVWADTVNMAGSTLDSRVQVYTRNAQGDPVLVASGSSNGQLTAGLFRDGWASFRAEAGREYFVQVLSDVGSGTGATGDYTIRINARTVPFPSLNPTTGAGTIAGNITLAGSDVVYSLVTGPGSLFDSLMTLTAVANATDLDSRLDVYGSDGRALRRPDGSFVMDSDAGNLSNAYTAFRASKSTQYFIRVRADHFQPGVPTATGAFTLVVDGIGTRVVLDPVTRYAAAGGALTGAQVSDLYTFRAEGSGLAIVTVSPLPLPPLQDSAIRVYDGRGVMIGFNELPGTSARVVIGLTGGQTYYAVVENFDGSQGGVYGIEIEAHHTYNGNVSPVLDDHASTPPGTLSTDEIRRRFEQATPLVFGPPEDAAVPAIFAGGIDPIAGPIAGDHSKVVIARGQGRIHAAGDTDLFQFVPPTDMLGVFEGADDQGDPPQWQDRYRPATRLQILVSPTAVSGPLVNMRVRVYDSNFNEVYDLNDFVMAGFRDPAGMLDPASFPPAMPIPPYPFTFAADQPGGIEVWGGEVYYLEVSGAGIGRYTLEVMADAEEDDVISEFYPVLPGEGEWTVAKNINIDPDTGEGSNYTGAASGSVIPLPGGLFTAVAGAGNGINLGRAYWMDLQVPPPPGTGANSTQFVGTPGSKGRLILQISDFAVITRVDTTHLYKFRALYDGFAEVRVNTTQIADEFFDANIETEDGDPNTPPVITVTRKTKTYNSPLDAALRVFDNDLTEIAYNNDNTVTPGEYTTINVGSFAGRTFFRRDPRVVFPVRAGNVYFVQVESGQREFAATPEKVDWRRATGSYELLINSMSNLNFVDDHVNVGGWAQATPLPVDLSLTSPTAVLGSGDGEIRNVPQNPDDSDLFFFIAPAGGSATVTVTTRAGDSFARRVEIYHGTTLALIGSAAATGTQPAVLSVQAQQGQRFFVAVRGETAADQGRYTVRYSGVPARDDFASESQFGGAFEIESNLYDYDRTETVRGQIEQAGDSDIFTFQALTWDVVTVTVASRTPAFSPFVRVYEISEDPDGNPVLLQVGFGAGTPTTPAATLVALTAPPRTSTVSGNTYNHYLVVVSGVNPFVDRGEYDLTLDFGLATDDHPDLGQWSLATPVSIGPTGQGGQTGNIELSGDTDLFQFTVPAGGLVTVNLISHTESRLYPRLRIFDADTNPVADLTTGQVAIVGPDLIHSVATFQFVGVRGAVYYILAEGLDGTGNVFKTDDTGRYAITVLTPVPDDHPNEGEFNIATQIPISLFTGVGTATGVIETLPDTDLFYFGPLADGNAVVTIDTPGSPIRPQMRLFDPATNEIGTAVVDGGPGDEDGLLNGSVRRTIAVVEGQRYYVLVQGNPPQTGSYTVTVRSPRGAAQGDDHANAGDWNNATLIPLHPLTGDGRATGVIEIRGDTDLFSFVSVSGTSARPARAFVHVLTPAGSALDVGVRIFGPDQQQIVADQPGLPGVNAAVQFSIPAPNQRYWVLVENVSGTGPYTVVVDTDPETFVLYYPEGFASDRIREYVSIANPNDFPVTYTIRLRYEGIDPELVLVSNAVIGPNTRGGVTISDGPAGPAPGVQMGKPYAIVIESDGFLAANISHYDFNATLGEAFTSRTSTFWAFARAERLPGSVRDFLVFYNPNPTAVRVTLTAYRPDGTSVSLVQTVQGFRRGGWNFNATSALPLGQFAFTVSSEPVNPSDEHIGIVAALSHYDLANRTGYGHLGDPDGGATSGVVPGLLHTDSVKTSVTLFNPNAASAAVGLVSRYISSAVPDVTRSVTIPAFGFVTLSGVDLGLTPGQLAGLRYTSNRPLAVIGGTLSPGAVPPDSATDATGANVVAASAWFFGDAFLNRRHAGTLYFETMYLYNPDVVTLPVTLRFIFSDGFVSSITVNVGSRSFTAVPLHETRAILDHRVFNFFSIEASASRPFAAKLNHYDLVLNGAWGTRGAPLGITTPLSLI